MCILKSIFYGYFACFSREKNFAVRHFAQKTFCFFVLIAKTVLVICKSCRGEVTPNEKDSLEKIGTVLYPMCEGD